jgi:hypothetical protein
MQEPSPYIDCTGLPSAPLQEFTHLPLSLTVYALNLTIVMLIGTTLNYYMLPVLAFG